jgi:hypothetical protein
MFFSSRFTAFLLSRLTVYGLRLTAFAIASAARAPPFVLRTRRAGPFLRPSRLLDVYTGRIRERSPLSARTRRRRALPLASLALPLLLMCVLAAGARSERQDGGGARSVGARASVGELPARSKRYALVVGVDDYADTQIGKLGGAANDARLLANALVEYAGFPRDQVILLATGEPPERQPTRGQILRRLSNLAAAVPADGLLLFSFAGHGVERGGRAFLLPSDAQLNDDVDLLEQTAVEARWVRMRIERAGVRQVLMLLDACRNDPTAGRSAAAGLLTENYRRAFNFEARNRGVEAFATLYATAVGQRAYEYKEKGHGYFTWALVEGLRGGAADARGEVTLAGLVKFVQDNVARRVALDLGPGREQRPFADVGGYRADELVVAVAPAAVVSPPTPAAPQPSAATETRVGGNTGASKETGGREDSAHVVRRRGRKAGAILFLDGPLREWHESLMGKEPAPPNALELDPFWRALSRKLVRDGVTTTVLWGDEARTYRLGLERGDKGVLGKINYAVVIIKVASHNPLDPYEGMQIARALVSLKAYDGYTGETLTQEVVADVRGFGNTREQAADNAYATAGEKVSDAFITRVLAAAAR